MIRLITRAETASLVLLAKASETVSQGEIAILIDALDDSDHKAIVYESQAGTVGFACYGPVPMTEGTWRLAWLFVREDQRCRGVGSRLLRHAEDDIRANHSGRMLYIEARSASHPESTHSFCRANGYEDHAVLRDFFADGDSLMVYRKELR